MKTHAGLIRTVCAAGLLAAASSIAAAEPASEQRKVVPLTRPEMKAALEALKLREPRLPLPAEEGSRGVNNGRMRSRYLPEEWSSFGGRGRGGARPADRRRGEEQAAGVDGTFKVWLFWIVSRINNCHYCLGHQELKLAAAGMSDDEIAALDGDWSQFPEDRRVVMELTRTMTLAPHTISDADVAPLRRHYTGEQILDIVQTVAGYNSTNRWTDSLGIPQDPSFGGRPAALDVPTSDQFTALVSTVAPVNLMPRPALESRAEVEAIWEKSRARQPRVAIAGDEEVARLLPDESLPAPAWVRAFAAAGGRQVRSLRAVATTGRIPASLKAQIAWSTARENRAWYAAHCAKNRLNELGATDDEVFTLDANTERQPANVRAALAFARKLTSTPQAMSDADIARLQAHYSDAEVAEIVFVVCQANMFDRVTETLGLPLDG